MLLYDTVQELKITLNIGVGVPKFADNRNEQ